MKIDCNIEKELKDLFNKYGRGLLNMIRGKKYAKHKRYLYKRFPMLQDKKYSDGMRIYWLVNGLNDFPECKCTENGIHKNKTHRCNMMNGYQTEYCCKECATIEGQKKINAVKLQRYGSIGYNNHEKAKKTLLGKFGVENVGQIDEIKNRIQRKRKPKMKAIMDKAWNTRHSNSTEKYGNFSFYDKKFLMFLDESPLSSFEVRTYTHEEQTEIRLKLKQYAQLQRQQMKPNFSADAWLSCKDKWNDSSLEWTCPEGHVFKDHFRTHYRENLRCPICNPYLDVGTSLIEKELQDFIESLGFEVQRNTRDIISPYEIDAYVPDRKIGFELDGLYSHCAANKKSGYHLMKTDMCRELGIQLIHIFEDEWNFKKDICKSNIKNLLGKGKPIDAHQLTVKRISSDEADKFFVDNCIFRHCRSDTIDIGLFSADKLAYVCSFSENGNAYHICRFCNEVGYDVHHAIDVCLKKFIEDFKPTSVTVCLDRRWMNAFGMHDLNEFRFLSFAEKTFDWIDYGANNRYEQFQMDDDFLKKLKKYDQNKTVECNLHENKFQKIFNCGYEVLQWKCISQE